MTSWNVLETYALVNRAFGREQELLTRGSVQSVVDRKSFAAYHFAEAIRLSKAFERKHLAGMDTMLDMHKQGGEETRRAFGRYIWKAGAHALAAVQSIHAIPDILSHAVYFASGQNLKPNALEEDKIALPKVAGLLKLDPSFVGLSKKLAEVQSGAGWRHLAALSNMSKHRSVVRSALSEDWTGSRTNLRELQLSSFERDARAYPSTSLRDLLEPEYDRISRAVVAIGIEINVCLR